MPFIMKKLTGRNCYSVTNRITGKVHSKCTTKSKAKAQMRLLELFDKKKKK